MAQEQNGFYKLSWLQRIGFGSGDLAQNLIYQTICMYLLIFYTNVYGLDPAKAAFMFLIVRIVDVLWDPLVGTYIDKHSPRPIPHWSALSCCVCTHAFRQIAVQ